MREQMDDAVFPAYTSENVKHVQDPALGLDGYLVLDATVNGRACGGLRISPSVSLQKVRDLARGMTLKQGFIGFARGGAKGGIVADETLNQDNKEKLVERYGELIKEYLLGRRYLSGPDMSTNTQLINQMYDHVGVAIPKNSTGSPNSGYFTAISVFVAIEEICRVLEQSIAQSTFAIEGFGSVGRSLSELIYREGGKVVAISNRCGALYDKDGLDIDDILSRKMDRAGLWITEYPKATHIKQQDLLTLPVDILCPCALDATINETNMTGVRAKGICAGANNPLTHTADQYLWQAGVICLPDFVTNCGGVLGNAMEYLGLEEKHFYKILRGEIAEKYRMIFQASAKAGKSPREICLQILDECFDRLKKSGEKKSTTSALVNFAGSLYKHALLPKFIIRPFAYRYFKKMAAKNRDVYWRAINGNTH